MTLDAAHTGYLTSHSQGRLATIAPDGRRSPGRSSRSSPGQEVVDG
jgi:hypothetical protein